MGTITHERNDIVRLLDVPATMAALGGISKRYLYLLLERGELDGLMQGRRRMITLASIDAYIERQLAQAAKTATPAAA